MVISEGLISGIDRTLEYAEYTVEERPVSIQIFGGGPDTMAEVADSLSIPVFGIGDCVTPEQIVETLRSGVEGVLVGRGVLRNPWILAHASDLLAGRPPRVA